MSAPGAIRKELVIDAPLEKVWGALTDPTVIGDWMDDDGVVFESEVGGRMLLFGGATSGTVLRAEAPRHLEYTWRQSEWPATWAESKVEWELSDAGDGSTRVRLTHDGFPNQEQRDSHDQGWDDYWLGPMIAHLEGSANK